MIQITELEPYLCPADTEIHQALVRLNETDHLFQLIINNDRKLIGTPLKRRVETDGTERPFVGYEDVDKRIPLNRQRTTLPCYQLWSYLKFTLEGYLSPCCSDFNADLVVGHLRDQTIMEAWHLEEFQALRQQHIDARTKGTLCEGRVLQKERPYTAINPHLMTAQSDIAAGSVT